MRRTRSQTRTTWPSHPNKHTNVPLQSIRHILDEHDLTCHDKGRDPDFQFTIFIHGRENKEPVETLIQEYRQTSKKWLLQHPPKNDEFTKTEWQDIVMRFGYADAKRKHGNEHSLRGLTRPYETRINVIIVSQTSNSTVQYNPPLTGHELTSPRDGEEACLFLFPHQHWEFHKVPRKYVFLSTLNFLETSNTFQVTSFTAYTNTGHSSSSTNPL